MNESNKQDDKQLEAVVGVFDDAATANRAANQLQSSDVELYRASRTDPTVSNVLPEIYYDQINGVAGDDVANGALVGGAIGAGSGLLFIGVPGLNIAAPIVGALAGAWIGSVAGIDEAKRGVELPNSSDYSKQLAEGKSFVVIAADNSARIKYAAELQKMGATEVHQHPPVREASIHNR